MKADGYKINVETDYSVEPAGEILVDIEEQLGASQWIIAALSVTQADLLRRALADAIFEIRQKREKDAYAEAVAEANGVAQWCDLHNCYQDAPEHDYIYPDCERHMRDVVAPSKRCEHCAALDAYATAIPCPLHSAPARTSMSTEQGPAFSVPKCQCPKCSQPATWEGYCSQCYAGGC